MTLRAIIFRVCLLVISVFVAYQLWLVAHVYWWIDHNPESSAFMETQLQVLQSKDPEAELKHRWIAYNQISPNLKKALITSEDAKFLDHEGFDWEGIQTAWEKNLKKGKIVAGGSTI